MGFIETCEEIFESIWPQHANLYASLIFGYLWVRLAKGFTSRFAQLEKLSFFASLSSVIRDNILFVRLARLIYPYYSILPWLNSVCWSFNNKNLEIDPSYYNIRQRCQAYKIIYSSR